MNNYNAKFGLYAGIIYIVGILGLNMISTKTMISISSWVGFIVPIVAMVLAVKEEKGLNKGSISFSSAFKHGWVTYLIYALLITIFTYVFYNFIDPTIKEEILKITKEAFSKMSGMVGEEATEKMIEEMEKVDTFGLKNTIQGFLVQLVMGGVIAAIIALIMKKEPNPWDTTTVDANPSA